MSKEPWLVVPTAGNKPKLLGALLRKSDCRNVVVHTRPESRDLPGAINSRYPISRHEDGELRAELNIHKWWNAGLDVVAERGGRYVVVANDDVICDASQLPKLLKGLRRTKSTLATPVWARAPRPGKQDASIGPDWHRSIAGWCWAIDLASGLRPDEGYRWYGGDDELDLAAKAYHDGVVAVRLRVRHYHSGPPWPSRVPDEAILADLDRLEERWPAAAAHAGKARRYVNAIIAKREA